MIFCKVGTDRRHGPAKTVPVRSARIDTGRADRRRKPVELGAVSAISRAVSIASYCLGWTRIILRPAAERRSQRLRTRIHSRRIKLPGHFDQRLDHARWASGSDIRHGRVFRFVRPPATARICWNSVRRRAGSPPSARISCVDTPTGQNWKMIALGSPACRADNDINRRRLPSGSTKSAARLGATRSCRT